MDIIGEKKNRENNSKKKCATRHKQSKPKISVWCVYTHVVAGRTIVAPSPLYYLCSYPRYNNKNASLSEMLCGPVAWPVSLVGMQLSHLRFESFYKQRRVKRKIAFIPKHGFVFVYTASRYSAICEKHHIDATRLQLLTDPTFLRSVVFIVVQTAYNYDACVCLNGVTREVETRITVPSLIFTGLSFFLRRRTTRKIYML